jgi:hypothetical protein
MSDAAWSAQANARFAPRRDRTASARYPGDGWFQENDDELAAYRVPLLPGGKLPPE